MEWKIVEQITKSILSTIENSAIASVRSVKEHVFPVSVVNFPKTQDVKGTVVVGNQKNVEGKLKEVGTTLKEIKKVVAEYRAPDSIKVSNFPMPEKYPEFPKSVEISNFPPPFQLKEIKITNQPTEELQNILVEAGKIVKAVKGLKLDPTINVEAPKPQSVVIPAPQVTVNEKEIDYEKMASVISSQMPEGIDYKKIADAIGKKLSEGLVSISGGGGGSNPFRNTSGQRSQPIVSDAGFLQVDVRNGNILTSFETNDVDKETVPIVYNGLEDKDGKWCIQKIDKSAGPSIRFATITNNNTFDTYATAWSNRADLEYSYFSEAF